MKLSTVIYVDDVPKVLDFYGRAFGIEAEFVDLDVNVPGREPGGPPKLPNLPSNFRSYVG